MKLNGYAPGDGSIDFVWVDDKGQAAVKDVTMDDVVRFLDNARNRHYFLKGWRPLFVNSRWALVKMFERVSDNQIQPVMDEEDRKGVVYTYTIDPEFGATVRQPGIKVTTEVEGHTLEVRNWSILDSICFFLNHEEEITKNIRWMKATTLPPLFDADKAQAAHRALAAHGSEDVARLIEDLRHYCQREKIDFDKAVRDSAPKQE